MTHANLCTCSHCTSLQESRATSEYWRSPAGVTRRIEMLSEHFTYQVINNSLMFYGQSAGVNLVRWVTMQDERVCPICGPLQGRVYRKGQFLPPLPAHANCRCQWELLFDPGDIVQHVLIPKITGRGFLVDAPTWSANLDIISKSTVFLLLFLVGDERERVKRLTDLQQMLIQQGYSQIEVEARTDEELEFWLNRGFSRTRGGRLRKNI